MRKLEALIGKSLKRQLINYIMIGVLLPLLIVMTGLLAYNRGEMKRQAVENVEQRLELAAGNMEQMLHNIESVSNHYAYHSALEEYTSRYYGNDLNLMNQQILALAQLFGKSDPLGTNIRIGALVTRHGELLNFCDPMMPQDQVLPRLSDMDINNSEKLSMMVWRPLEENYFTSVRSGNPRQDRVVVGTRRIINVYSGVITAIHIFIIPEEQLWGYYENLITDQSLGEESVISVLDGEGRLLSSSSLEGMTGEEENPIIKRAFQTAENKGGKSFELTEEGRRYLVSVRKIGHSDWSIISVTPLTAVTRTIDILFLEILLVAAGCGILCFFIILYISKRFLKPISLLKASMQEVYDGNMDAYVSMDGDGEIQEMGRYYNSMLEQINQFVVSRVETEKKKKQLELEVIMGQVNPHFLYNTLENIVWKSSEAGYPEIGRLAASLGRMYRLSISRGEIVVRVQQEIEHLMSYINIQKVRYRERMDFDLLVDYEEIRDYMTIKLLLQPAVENCFMYAMEGTGGILSIRVRVKVFDNFLRFEVIDNGAGMEKELLEKVRKQIREGSLLETEEENISNKKGSGIGLYSISERIKLYFGRSDAVQIRSRKNRGTAVVITLPLVPYKRKTKIDDKDKIQTIER